MLTNEYDKYFTAVPYKVTIHFYLSTFDCKLPFISNI